ncbi:hypothetical protein F3Y22_tig00110156pilonHSYRG00081 [Hibiscus syriacus]|uniref:Aminotransferase class I/classII large domain-containing protein n=1 Tax=Hibiscus syriacus TaxID=106335 RepID=A0A6A3BJ66_HIBSY|nr:hypothetical protein F3Y22_tig00110156pilonHSYRG00081 [Hibiscus syriacus]
MNSKKMKEYVQTETEYKKLILFAGNDFLGLSRHPTIAKATAKARWNRELVQGDLHSSVDIPIITWHWNPAWRSFGANMAVMVAIGSIVPVLCEGRRPTKEERTNCKNTRKVVVTDSLFSMDGDIAPMAELAQLRKKHGFLWVLDDAHGTFVWGKNGGGLAEEFNCEYDVDISIGTLSKAASSLWEGSKIWKQWIQSRGRSFIFSTIAPVPLAAASYASVVVAKKETWRRREIQNRMKELQALTGIPVKSQIVCVIIGDMMQAIKTNHELLKSGFYCVAVGPPAVAPNTARLRLTLTAVHTSEDIKRLAAIISKYVKFQVPRSSNCSDYITPRL